MGSFLYFVYLTPTFQVHDLYKAKL